MTRKPTKGKPLTLYALFFQGMHDRWCHSLDYPKAWMTRKGVVRYLRHDVPKVKRPIYRIVKLVECP